MPDDPAFVRTIAASPEDDAPRLVYADVLDETGDPAKVARAEFIRVQIEKARLVPETPRWNELWHRDTALLEWARRWRSELPTIEGVQYGGFLRGFIDRVDVRAPSRLEEATYEHFRTRRGRRTFVTVYERSPFLERAADVFDAVPVRVLSLYDLTGDGPEKLVELDGFCHVVELDIHNDGQTPKFFESLIARGPWPNLRRLNLSAPQPGPHEPLADILDRLHATFRTQMFTGLRLTTDSHSL